MSGNSGKKPEIQIQIENTDNPNSLEKSLQLSRKDTAKVKIEELVEIMAEIMKYSEFIKRKAYCAEKEKDNKETKEKIHMLRTCIKIKENISEDNELPYNENNDLNMIYKRQ